jgi:hypothetical protein
MRLPTCDRSLIATTSPAPSGPGGTPTRPSTSAQKRTGPAQSWHEYDWPNWRRRIFRPAARAAGVEDPRADDLRHPSSACSTTKGHSIVEIAAQLGHDPSTCLSTYGHVIAELRDAPRVSDERKLRIARGPDSDPGDRSSARLGFGDPGH